jgi:hypothetical protein
MYIIVNMLDIIKNMFSDVSNTEQLKTNKGVSSMAKKKTMTIQKRVETALLNGEALTSSAIKNRFGAGNPGAVIQALRFKGLPVFLNTNKRSGVKVYRTGKASRMVVGLGYKALAKGVQL